jgi:hypothetical protein
MARKTFPDWLASVVGSNKQTHVEDHQRWADRLAANGGPADAVERAELKAVLVQRLARGGAVTAVEKAAALATAIDRRATDILPAAFRRDGSDKDLMAELAAHLNEAVPAETAAGRAGRIRLFWLLRSVGRHRAALEPNLAPPARDALTAVTRLGEGRSLPMPAAGDTAFLEYLREVAAPVAPPTSARPTLTERLRRFVGGNRFNLTRVGLVRLAVVGVLTLVAAVGLFCYSAARDRVAAFREQNKLPLFEKSLMPR